MAYLDMRKSPAARRGPIAAVIAIHAGLGYLLVTGLGGVIARHTPIHLPTIEFPTAPPEVEDPPPPPQPTNPSIVQAPKPPLDLSGSTRIEVDPVVLPPIDELVLPPSTGGGSGTKPLAVKLFDPVAPRPRNDPSTWITTADYPSGPLRREQEGTARFRLEIAASGKVENCTITRSSGVEQLDQATCRLASRRARFDPARDAADKPVTGSYDGSVRWVIPD